MNINMLKKPFLIGALYLATQVTAQAVTIRPVMDSNFSAVTATTGTVYNTGNKPTSTILSWKDSDCRTCAKSRIRFDSLGPVSQSSSYSAGFGSPFTLGVLRFTNLTGPDSSGVQSAQLNLSVLLWDTMLEPLNMIFDVSLEQAATPPSKAQNKKSSDLLSITYDLGSYTFNTPNGTFQLDILGWSKDRGNSFTNTLKVGNNTFGGLRLYGVINPVLAPVPSAVPVPAAAWLMSSGLLGLVGVARRRQHA